MCLNQLSNAVLSVYGRPCQPRGRNRLHGLTVTLAFDSTIALPVGQPSSCLPRAKEQATIETLSTSLYHNPTSQHQPSQPD